MSAAEIVSKVRKLVGDSRAEFAKRIGLTTACIVWQYENGKRQPSPRVWMALADVAKEVGVIVTISDMR